MQFDSLAALWWMNGHGPYVWSAYALAAITLIAIVWLPLQKRRRFFAEQRGIERRRHARQQQSEQPSSVSETKS